MKILRKILKGLLVFLLIDLIGLLVLSCCIQNVLIEGVIKETIKAEIKKAEEEELKNGDNSEVIKQITSNEDVQRILNSKEVQDLINKYLDITIDGMLDEEKLNDSTIEDDMINFLDNHRADIESITGEKISDEDFLRAKEEIKNAGYDKVYRDNIIKMSNNMGNTEKSVIKGYQFFTSDSFKIILIISIIVDLILIALVEWSFYKWIKTLGNSMITSGIMLSITSIIVSIIVKSLSKYNFNTIYLLISGIALIIWGLLIKVIYAIILRKTPKEEERVDEVSEVSYEE